MVSIRPYEERDNARLPEIESNKETAMGADKSPDAIGRFRLYNITKGGEINDKVFNTMET